MMLASYATYTVCRALGVDPLIALIPAALVTALFGGGGVPAHHKESAQSPRATSSFYFRSGHRFQPDYQSHIYFPDIQVVSRILIDVARYRRSSFGRMVLCVCRSAVIYAVGLQMFLTKQGPQGGSGGRVRPEGCSHRRQLMSIGHTGACVCAGHWTGRWPWARCS